MPPSPLPAILSERDLRAAELDQNPVQARLRLYAWMRLARVTDNRILDLFRQGLIKGTVTGGQGNESLIIPLALLADKAIDVISFTQRGLGGHLIWSGGLSSHLDQYFANAASPTWAREGNVHHGDPANRSLPMMSHLGAMLGLVLGTTDGQRRRGKPAVGFTFFGDGGSSTGDVHEAMNLASVLSLPVVFVIENNRYAYSTPTSEQFAPGVELWKRAAGYGMEGYRVECGDPVAAARTLARAIDQVRTTSRPVLVEAMTVRLRGHAAYDTCSYLTPQESAQFDSLDPMPPFRAEVIRAAGEAAVLAIEAELDAYLEAAVVRALAVPRPEPGSMLADVFAPPSAPLPWKAEPAVPENLTLAQALGLGQRKILSERPESILLGQDIARYGGAFKVTEGLYDDFGRSRVLNTPICESACTGYAIGLAVGGHRPIEEFQFADFATEAVTQITLNAGTMHFRSGAACPLVLRLPCGGGVTLGTFHSQELESLFLSIPGLKALYPSTPQDAFNALLAAYEDNNPVLLFEHKGLYRRGKHPVAWDPAYREVWQPRPVRAGDHATLFTYGEMVQVAVDACDYLASEYEVSIEVIDLRCLAPLNYGALAAAVARTRRLIVLHEGRLTHGFGAEIVARIASDPGLTLAARPLRIGSLDMPVPFAPELEAVYRPNRDSVVERIVGWLS